MGRQNSPVALPLVFVLALNLSELWLLPEREGLVIACPGALCSPDYGGNLLAVKGGGYQSVYL